jgi:hypothetical protein
MAWLISGLATVAAPAIGAASLGFRDDIAQRPAMAFDADGTHAAPQSVLYAVTGAGLQQSALHGTISGLNIGVPHTISLGWATLRHDGAATTPVEVWGLAFGARTFAPARPGPAAESFCPWIQDRFGQALQNGARNLPIADTVVETTADPEPAQVPEQPIDAEMVITGSGQTSPIPEPSTIAFLAAIGGLFGLLYLVVRRIMSQNATDARATHARMRATEQGQRIVEDDLAANVP